ncbi:MAG: tetratricopeptide repeat protein [Deltaproteobacteria bacterium]|nr:tetratricopeptide repeat protein [Deltaproteobacteria bacterium]MDZ4345930.1 tetratricopeptide repeat protein [Candidatus Binatia bacterium]
MQTSLLRHSFFISYAVIAIACFAIAGCTYNLPRFGIGGRYEEGRDQFLRGRGGDMDTAVVALQSVVSQDPTYKNSLTYLGRAYYRKQRYKDAYAILQRALAVNKEDEIAWMAFGVTQLRLGQDEKGFETLKGGITLLSKVAVEGYRDYPYWDGRGTVRGAIRQGRVPPRQGARRKDQRH